MSLNVNTVPRQDESQVDELPPPHFDVPWIHQLLADTFLDEAYILLLLIRRCWKRRKYCHQKRSNHRLFLMVNYTLCLVWSRNLKCWQREQLKQHISFSQIQSHFLEKANAIKSWLSSKLCCGPRWWVALQAFGFHTLCSVPCHPLIMTCNAWSFVYDDIWVKFFFNVAVWGEEVFLVTVTF